MVPGKPGHGHPAARGLQQKHALSQHDNEAGFEPNSPQNMVTPTFDRAVQPSRGAMPAAPKMGTTDLAATLLLHTAKDSI